MIQLYTTFLFEPLLNLLVLLYAYLPGHDLGLAIIGLTLIIKIILYPLSHKAIQSQRALQLLQPKLDELKRKYKGQKEKLAQEMMQLYKNEKINPLSSCLPLLVQLPFLIAVYHVFQQGLHATTFDQLYSFVPNPGTLNPISFGFLDLSAKNLILAVLAGGAQFWQTKMLMHTRAPKNMPGAKDEDMAAMMNKQMMYMMPVMTVFIGASLPAGLVLYWLATTVLTAVQQLITFRRIGQPEPASIAKN